VATPSSGTTLYVGAGIYGLLVFVGAAVLGFVVAPYLGLVSGLFPIESDSRSAGCAFAQGLNSLLTWLIGASIAPVIVG
jgi:hypothetical protein